MLWFARLNSVLLIAGLWWFFLTSEQQVLGVVLAAGYGLIEYLWYGMSTVDSEGTVRFAPLSPNRRKCYTSWAQFFANVVCLPVMIEGLWTKLPHWSLRLLVFPLIIWLFEVVAGYYLWLVWDARPWTYRGKDAFFHGNIKLAHWKVWALLAISLEFSYHTLLLPGSRKLCFWIGL